MSKIRQLIDTMRKEDNVRDEDDRKHFVEQNRIHKDLVDRLSDSEDKITRHLESIHSGLQQLNNHKHSIEKALQEVDNLPGLPLPHEDHGAFIKFISEAHDIMNNPDIVAESNSVPIEEIQNDIIITMENVGCAIEDCKTAAFQAEALYHRSKELKQLESANDNVNDDTLES